MTQQSLLESLQTDAKFPLLFTAFLILIYVVVMLLRRKRLFSHLNICAIFVSYWMVFLTIPDRLFIYLIPFGIGWTTATSCQINNDMANLLCVIISILTAAIVSFMAMTSGKADSIANKQSKDKEINDNRDLQRNCDCQAVGMYSIALSIILLIAIFLKPIIQQNTFLIDTMIFTLFYHLLLNIFIMMRKLHLIYS